MTPPANDKKRRFVKYRNRKIHEVGSQEAYVSMEYVADLVKRGVEVEVIDDVTSEDLTAETLARIVYDACRTQAWNDAPAAIRALSKQLGFEDKVAA